MDNIVESIQQDILDSSVSLNTILLKAKLLAHHLKNERFKQWVKYEIDGYSNDQDVPDYRIIYTPLLAYIHNGYNGYNNLPISLSNTPDWFQRVGDRVCFTPGIRTIEDFASSEDAISFDWPADWVMIWNHYNPLGYGRHQCYQVKRPIAPSVFAQILLTVRSRLQDFVLELSDLPWKIAKDSSVRDQIERLVTVTIYNNSQGGTMATFDQRNQQVQNQNNAAGDVNITGDTNIGTVQSTNDFIRELQKLKSELLRAGDTQIVDAEIVTDADYEIASAIQEAKKPEPDKKAVLTHMDKVKSLLDRTTEAVGLATVLAKLIEVARTLF